MVSTDLNGSIVGDIFTLIVEWENGSTGQYSAFFTGLLTEISEQPSSKRLVGITFDANQLKLQTTWVSSKTFEVI